MKNVKIGIFMFFGKWGIRFYCILKALSRPLNLPQALFCFSKKGIPMFWGILKSLLRQPSLPQALLFPPQRAFPDLDTS